MSVSSSVSCSLTLDGNHHSKQPPPPPPPPTTTLQSPKLTSQRQQHPDDLPTEDDATVRLRGYPQYVQDPEKGGATDADIPVSSRPVSAAASDRNHNCAPLHNGKYEFSGEATAIRASAAESPLAHINAGRQCPRATATAEPQSAPPLAWTRYNPMYDGDGYSDHDSWHKPFYVWRVLGYLACLNPLLSALNALYTLLTLLVLLIEFPLKNIATSAHASFPELITSRLSLQLVLHLRFIYPQPHPVPSAVDIGAARLLAVLLLSPVVAIPISAMAAGVMFVWLYTEVLLGDKNDEGGMEYRSFLFVRQRWENFILAALKPKDLDNGDPFRSER